MNQGTAVAVVTGGASGIGAACCRELARRGYKVAVADIDEAAAARVASEIGGAAFAVDVADEASAEDLAERVERALGPVDALVNSAGVIQVPLSPETLPMSSWDQVVRVDQRGTYVACLAFGRRMAARGRGAIVNIASVAGMRSMPLHAYAPAKAAVISMTECLAAEWGRSGVRVNAVAPGWTVTPMIGEKGLDPANVARVTATMPLKKFGTPEDVAAQVVALASDRISGHVTGQVVVVAGGMEGRLVP